MALVHQQRSEISKSLHVVSGKKGWHKPVVNVALLIIVVFQLVNLPGAVLSRSVPTILITLLSLALCGVAFFFQRLGKIPVVSVLLIAVVNLGCVLTLLTAPGGLDIGNLPTFDVLVVSELIAVFLLPAESEAKAPVQRTPISTIFSFQTTRGDGSVRSGLRWLWFLRNEAS